MTAKEVREKFFRAAISHSQETAKKHLQGNSLGVLEEKLEIAVKEELYELAAYIRDTLRKRKEERE